MKSLEHQLSLKGRQAGGRKESWKDGPCKLFGLMDHKRLAGKSKADNVLEPFVFCLFKHSLKLGKKSIIVGGRPERIAPVQVLVQDG